MVSIKIYNKDDSYLKPSEVAQMLMVAPVTVRQWARKGWLHAELTAGGHRRFSKREVVRFAQERGLTLHCYDSEEGLRLLIVEDDSQYARYLIELLKGQGGIDGIAVAGNGFEAGILTQQFNPHVVLLDLMMPGLDGFSVCERLKQDPTTRLIRIIAMTGFATEENKRRILNAGAERCLEKPIEPRVLFDAIGLSNNDVMAL